jgi:hypothetical protein
MENPKTGYNINNFINITETATEFVKYFYSTLSTTPQVLIDSGIFKEYTIFKYEGKKYLNNELIKLLGFLHQHSYTITNMECIESGARRIDINVVGKINDQYLFSQTFSICHQKTHWVIKNSTLIILS